MVFFLDDYYFISDIWPRYCRYAFVNSLTGFTQVSGNFYPPSNLSGLDTVYNEWQLQYYTKPALTFADSSFRRGCCDIWVYIENHDQNAYLIILANKSQLSLLPASTEFDLSQENTGLDVHVDFYYYLPTNYWPMRHRYCTDLASYVRLIRKWIGKSGKIKIAVSADNKETIELEDVEFLDKNNENRVILESLLLSDIDVGWCPG